MPYILQKTEEENEEEINNKAFIGMCETSSETSSEDFLDEVLVEVYKHLTSKWKQSCQVIEQQEKIIKKLAQEKEEVTLLNSKLTNMTKFVRMSNKGTNMLDEVLQIGKRSSDTKGLGFHNHINKEVKTAPKKTIHPKKKSQEQMSNRMSQHPAQHKHKK
jgi:hypothetical protein